ncbi:hypothetical protein L210DRAFT_3392510 [Boletus edulis BED1]|uniref:Uncharacterized protein n=1 Tax=Boletus edulis BED1 TaxID=1328754 RepID=A0AAD4C2P8_BOLED|nr:hypothetical protein L210DRAFT_3392510 [Boletus edulis BED1]
MWPTNTLRYVSLLPSPDPGSRTIKLTLVRRGNFILVIFAVAILVGAARFFDFQVTVASKRPVIVSPEIFPEGSISSTTSTAAEQSLDASLSTHFSPAAIFLKEHLSVDEIKAMVSQTRGFYTRDYSLGLGWNNVRYIIEASAFQARLLDRTLILPSFVYARSCAYKISVCADEAPMLNRGDAIGWDSWRDLPIEQQMGWQLPITTMINITQLRRFQPVITTAEYLRYAGLPSTHETTSGYWNRSGHHQSPGPFASHGDRMYAKPTLFVIENARYDPEGVTRVDMIPDVMKERGGWIAGNLGTVQASRWESHDHDTAQLLLKRLLLDKAVVEWDEARSAVRDLAVQMPEVIGASSDLESDAFLEQILNRYGWEVLYTFQGAAGMDFVKHVVTPIRQVAQRTSLRGFIEDYRHVDADIVLLAGETHLYRKPGQMRFTTQTMRELFQDLVVHHVVPLDKVYKLARKLDFRISAINNGRQWMASHIRRGDFVTAGWAWGNSHEGHLQRVKQHLDEGRNLLQSEHRHTAYSIPGIVPDTSIPRRGPPLHGDKFFVATDESDPEKLNYFSENGALMFRDLVTFEDRHEFGWGILFSDIIGLVEQATLARASYFYGSAMSSFTGGVFNMRAVLGAEEITGLAD